MVEEDTSQNQNQNQNYFSMLGKYTVMNIFSYLNLNNISLLPFVCKRFHNIISRETRSSNSMRKKSFGFSSNYEDEEEEDSKTFCKLNSCLINNTLNIKGYDKCIKYLEVMDNLELIATSPGDLNYDVSIWNQTTGWYKYDITEEKCVECMCYQPEQRTLSVAYADGQVIVYEFDCDANYSVDPSVKKYNIRWKRLAAKDGHIINKMAYVRSMNQLLTLEVYKDQLMNFVKAWDHQTGSHVKSAVLCNSIIMCFKAFEMLPIPVTSIYDEPEPEICDMRCENYLVLSLNEERRAYFEPDIQETGLAIKSYSKLEENFNEIIPDICLYGHTSTVSDVIYMKTRNWLLSCSDDLYIFVWDLQQRKMIEKIDSAHDDKIYSMACLNNDTFATSGKDRKIFIWSFSMGESARVINEISSHTSDVFEIKYSRTTPQELFSVSMDKTLRGFSFTPDFKHVCKQRKLAHSFKIVSAKIDYVHNQLITVGDKVMCFWDMNTFSLLKTLDIKCIVDDFIRLYDDYSTFVLIDNTPTMKLFNEQKEEAPRAGIVETSKVCSIMNTYDGVSFLVGLGNGMISIYQYVSTMNETKFRKTRTLYHGNDNDIIINTPQKLEIRKLIPIDLNLKIVASLASNSTICVFYFQGKDVKKEIIKPPPSEKKGKSEISAICGVKFTNDVELIAFSVDEHFFLYDILLQTDQSINLGRVSDIEKINENYLALCLRAEGMLLILEIESMKIIKKFPLSAKNVNPFLYLQDGKRFFAVSGVTKKMIDIISFS